MQRFLLILSFCLLLMGSRETPATPPTLYSQMANESPVHGDPGDLLMIAGAGFASTDTVVYTSLSNTTLPLSHPASVPATSTATTGVAPVVNTVNVPSSLVVSLPAVMTAKQSYALWVRNASGEWSNGVRINDARPNWISPDKVYVGSPVAFAAALPKSGGSELAGHDGCNNAGEAHWPCNLHVDRSG